MEKYYKITVLFLAITAVFIFFFFNSIPTASSTSSTRCLCCNSTRPSYISSEDLCTATCRAGQDYVRFWGDEEYQCQFPCDCCWRGGELFGQGYSRGRLTKQDCQNVCSTSGGVKRWGDYTITAECPTPEEGACNCCFAGAPQEGEYLSLTECRTACLDYGGAKQLLTPEGRWTNPAGCPEPGEEETAPSEAEEEAPPTGGPLTGGLSSAAARAGFGGTKIENILQTIINVVLGFVGVIFLIMILYGGLIWMTARGSPEDVEKAKKLIEAAIIGIIIVFAAYGVSYFLISKFAPGAPAAPAAPEEKLAPEEIPTECVPLTECPAGRCGTMDDGCGGTISCPSCPSGQICQIVAGTTVSRCEAAPTEPTAICTCCDRRSRGNQTMTQCLTYCQDRGGMASWGSVRRPCP
jgi:hypothetical protein